MLIKPRQLVRAGAYYGPAPRKTAAASIHADDDAAVASLILLN
ncbi:MAG: hypothetical protein P8Y71_26735 [Pseudolabrys sp.]